MNEWPTVIWASISAMTAALVLGFIVVLGSMGRQGAEILQENDNAVAIVKEYRQYSYYNGTTVFPQDVITAIAESQGMPEIWVDTRSGLEEEFNWKWTRSTDALQFSTAYLTSIFPTNVLYDSTLEKDLNGAIVRIEFRRQ